MLPTSIRRSDCVEAELVLSTGEYLVFRLDVNRKTISYLVEVDRSRMNMRPREVIFIDAHILGAARSLAFNAIMAHREKMRIPPPPIEERVGRHIQLAFPLTK